MKWLLLLVSASALVAVAGVGRGGPVTPQEPSQIKLSGLESRFLSTAFNGGTRSVAIATTKANTANLGLYVYDSQGNCVAWDDESSQETQGNAAAEWFPLDKATYLIEVRNNTFHECNCKFILH